MSADDSFEQLRQKILRLSGQRPSDALHPSGMPDTYVQALVACLQDGAERHSAVAAAIAPGADGAQFSSWVTTCRARWRDAASARTLGDLEWDLHQAITANESMRRRIAEGIARLRSVRDASRYLRADVLEHMSLVCQGKAATTPIGSLGRMAIGPHRTPLFLDAECDALGTAAEPIARAAISQPSQFPANLGFDAPRPIFSVPYVSKELLEAIDRATGTKGSVPIAIVPRAYVTDRVVLKMMIAERHEMHLSPTPLIATKTHLCWVIKGEVRSLSYVDDMPDWSELFDRAPFASFGHADLGLQAKDGQPECLDLFMMPNQAITQTSYGYTGLPRHLLISGCQKHAHAAYTQSGQIETCTTRKQAIELHLGARAPAEIHQDGFQEDIQALHMFFLPFHAQGGFTAFLPRGLDPIGTELFRYPSVRMSAEALSLDDGPVVDPLGDLLRCIGGRRGLSIPLFLEAHGTTDHGSLESMLRVLERLWPDVRKQRRLASGIATTASPSWPIADASQRSHWQAEYDHATAQESGDSLAKAKAVVQALPQNPVAWFELGQCLRAAGQSEDALKALDTSMQLDARARTLWIQVVTHDDQGREAEREALIRAVEDLQGDLEGSIRVRQRIALFRSLYWSSSMSANEQIELRKQALRLTALGHDDEGRLFRDFLIQLNNEGTLDGQLLSIAQNALAGNPYKDWAWSNYFWICLWTLPEEEHTPILQKSRKLLGDAMVDNMAWDGNTPLICPIDGTIMATSTTSEVTVHGQRDNMWTINVADMRREEQRCYNLKLCSEKCQNTWNVEGAGRLAAKLKAN
jgi:tetratricopeptide (TPR) repeat protein